MVAKGKGTVGAGIVLLACVVFIASCRTSEKNRVPQEPVQWSNNLVPVKSEYKRVKISWFEDLFYKRNMSSKDSYEKQDFLVAHRTLPIGTISRAGKSAKWECCSGKSRLPGAFCIGKRV